MASFLSGPAAELVGAGMQAIGVGIPVGETSAKVINGLRSCGLPVPPKTWFKSKDDAREQQARSAEHKTIYDKLEFHVNGVVQVVKPVIELKKLVRENCCKSAERPRRDTSQSPKEKLRYYTPQKCMSGACSLVDERKSPSPKRKATKESSKRERRPRRCARRRDSSSSDAEEDCCVYCSRTRSLLKLPCGRFICSKCDKTGDHELECKQCQAAEKSRVYAY